LKTVVSQRGLRSRNSLASEDDLLGSGFTESSEFGNERFNGRFVLAVPHGVIAHEQTRRTSHSKHPLAAPGGLPSDMVTHGCRSQRIDSGSAVCVGASDVVGVGGRIKLAGQQKVGGASAITQAHTPSAITSDSISMSDGLGQPNHLGHRPIIAKEFKFPR
jgi:hypothetical protein